MKEWIDEPAYESLLRAKAWGRHLVVAWAAAGLIALAGCMATTGLTAGQEGRGPWWMQATSMTPEGLLDLDAKSWLSRAKVLKIGEQFWVHESGPGRHRELVRREKIKIRSGQELDAIVWIIDDGQDGSLERGGDRVNDCYVADYDGDGRVDRMVDWIDNDSDGTPDEMDIRYFEGGSLNYCWFGADYDGDGHMWSLAGYEYGGPSFFEADPYGNNMIYMNKFNPTAGTWAPISECPFAFYDTDADGFSEQVVRFSAVPLDYDRDAHPDYANNQYMMSWSGEMERMGVVNVRYSFDIDDLSGPEHPLHYDCGFNLVGAEPYQYAGMYHYNPRRRPPQTTVVAPYDRVRAIGDRFPAAETGLSWHENVDDTIAIGHGPHADQDWRWEGVFWIWERRFMENTGGPNQKWNVRREWRSSPSTTRELYLSGVDGRLHLVGAEEGWIQVGHFAGLGTLGEIRMFDTDANGFFDRWEVYLGGNPQPARVTTVRDEKVTLLGPFDYQKVRRLYTGRVLPAATATGERLMAAMAKVHEYTVDQRLQTAMSDGPPGFRRYARDVACELHYQDLRRHYTKLAQGVLDRSKMNDLRTPTRQQRETTPNSHTAWKLLRVLERLDVAFGQGDVDQTIGLLDELAKTAAPLSAAR